MPSRKQRRRREKLQRHEYEYYVEGEEGEELPLESPRQRPRESEEKPAQVLDRRGRPMPKPSFQRVLKRAAIFGPLLVVLVFVTGSKLSTGAKIFNALVLLALFLPFSYMIDVLVYRAMQRRQRRG